MITTAVLLLSGALGALSAPVANSGVFSVTANINPKFVPHGPTALRKVLGKYNLPMPHGLVSRQEGSVAANPGQYDALYVCPVTIGTSTVNLDFDTGSADLWVFSNEMSSSQSQGHHVFTPGSTFKKTPGATWEIRYGDGSSASGSVGTDKVTIGKTVVEGQTVELAKTVASQFVQDTFMDGLLGLAFSTINTVKTNGESTPKKTFSENALASTKANVFTADLKHATPGSYDFGYIDDKKHNGDLVYTPIDSSNGFWEFPSSSYKVANTTYHTTSGSTAIADTGTTLLLVSTDMARQYYENTGAKLDQQQGGYTFPCKTAMPDISVAIGGFFATIPGSDMAFAPLEEGSSTCFGALQGANTKQFIFGDVFFKRYFSVFDIGKTQFGFAPKA